MGIDPSLAERIAKDGIVAGGRNFGCGSSREVSAQAFVLNGIHIIIAESFARIFFRNCLNLGMCLIEVPDLLDEVAEGDLLEIHPAAGVIINQTKDKRLEEVRVSMR
jgi:3-isopropylmalate/(R)-2-methylmalate dehydratase small subunit